MLRSVGRESPVWNPTSLAWAYQFNFVLPLPLRHRDKRVLNVTREREKERATVLCGSCSVSSVPRRQQNDIRSLPHPKRAGSVALLVHGHGSYVFEPVFYCPSAYRSWPPEATSSREGCAAITSCPSSTNGTVSTVVGLTPPHFRGACSS